MDANRQLLDQFYQAFQKRDYQTMQRCYHPRVHFEDPVFKLDGKLPGAMWHMLCERGKDLQLEYKIERVDEHKGKVHWEPVYTFSKTGRKVHNIIDAEFSFQDGLIITHIDQFDFWRWSRQALGAPGLLLGWSGFLRKKVAHQANASLAVFVGDHQDYQESDNPPLA